MSFCLMKLQLPLNSINTPHRTVRNKSGPLFKCCSNANPPQTTTTGVAAVVVGPPVVRRRKRYRKPYPGESEGITEEMRFVAMRLRNKKTTSGGGDDVTGSGDDGARVGESWVPSMEGFVKYLVDSKLVFETVERIVDKSEDVSFAYFRRTGLERSEGIAKDLAWISEQGILIPEPSNPGITYAKYLEDLANNSAPLFLPHFYNIYFAHIAAHQVIATQVSDMLLKGRELEFYTWDGDVQELLKGVRQNINKLSEHWARDVKNKCLKEAKKSFGYLGQIVRLIIL